MASVSVLVSSTEILAADNSNRTKGVVFTNLGSNDVWIKKDGETAVVNEGMCLKATTGHIYLQAHRGELSSVWNAIAETGTTEISAYRIT